MSVIVSKETALIVKYDRSNNIAHFWVRKIGSNEVLKSGSCSLEGYLKKIEEAKKHQ